MNAQEYYGRVIDRLRNCYQFEETLGQVLQSNTHRKQALDLLACKT
jgi:hypothetical protein